MHCEPASLIITRLGGISAVSKIAKTSLSTVMRWRTPMEKGGTNGFIPRKHHAALIEAARAIKINLTNAAFLDVSEAQRVLNRVKRENAA